MIKKDFIVVLAIVIGAIILAFIINVSLTYGDLIETKLPLNNWLDFWGGYCGGVFALIVGYLAIIYSNRNSEKAINQQYQLLQEQDKRKNLNEYVNCLKGNLNAINPMNIVKLLGNIDSENLQYSLISLYDKKNFIYNQELEFNYIMALNGEANTDSEKQYIDCWNKAKDCYKQQLEISEQYVRRIRRHKTEGKLYQNIERHLYLLKQQPTIGNNEDANTINSYMNELVELKKSIDSYEKDIDEFNNSIIKLTDKLLPTYQKLFELSILVVKEKNLLLNNDLEIRGGV